MTTPILSYSGPLPCRQSADLLGVTTADAFISGFYVVTIGFVFVHCLQALSVATLGNQQTVEKLLLNKRINMKNKSRNSVYHGPKGQSLASTVCVGFVVGRMALKLVLNRVVQFSRVLIIPPVLPKIYSSTVDVT